LTKDCRIVVRMSEELRDWVHAQASLGEQDDAAFVRMVLSNLRRGRTPISQTASTAPVTTPAPIRRDILDVASGAAPQPAGAAPSLVEELAGEPAIAVDVDAMVASAVAVAEEEGLTVEQLEESQGEMPDGGVKPLFRRPIAFSPASNHQRLEQFFGAR
jgi:hypothetical protein